MNLIDISGGYLFKVNVRMYDKKEDLSQPNAMHSKVVSHENIPLKRDPDIQFMCPPLDSEAHALLEKSLKEKGCLNPVIYWEGPNVIVDGHNRDEICSRLKIPYERIPMHFDTKEDALNFVIDHQLGRRNLSDLQKSYLRGKRYLTEKKAAHRPSGSEVPQDDGVKGETAKKIAEETGVSPATVERDAVLAEAIDELREKIGDDFGKTLRNEKAKIPKKGIIELAKRPLEVLKSFGELIKEGVKPAKAIEIVQSQKASSGQEVGPGSPKDRELEKIEQYLTKALKALDKMEAAGQKEQVAELAAIVGRIFDRLAEIGEVNSDSSGQKVDASEDIQTDVKQDSVNPDLPNPAPKEENAEKGAGEVGPELSEEDSSGSENGLEDLSEDWEFYKDAIEDEHL